MMAYSEDHIALAAEYALGTLDVEERAQVETMMATDAEYAKVVDAWIRQLGVLNQMVGSVEPRAEVWDRIKAAVAVSATDAAHPQVQLAADNVTPAASSVGGSNVVDFPKQIRRWRSIATAASALAAVLVAFVAVQAYRPDMLPPGMRPKPMLQQTAQTPPVSQGVANSAQYVALLQRDGSSPAFILTVDAGSKNFTVRKVDAASEPGRSYELWIVSDKLQKPRSLGVIGGHDFTIRPDLASYAPDMVSQATYAVTVEPEGGSPTGQATGPIVFKGKLIETVPQVK